MGARRWDRRISYEVAVPLTAAEKRKLEARARDEVQLVSGYVAKLIVETARRPTTFKLNALPGGARREFRFTRRP